ncbi:MAG: peptidyl-prolyl cis-trans isomerase [Acidimicrobiaceae bacterium]
MGTAKRERQKQGRQVRLEQAIADQKRKQRMRSLRNVGLIIVAIVVALLVTSRFFGGDSKTPVATTASSSSADTATSTTLATSTTAGSSAPAAAFTYGSGACPNADGSSPRTIDFTAAPQLCIDPAKTYVATFDTTAGTVKVKLDPTTTPGTTNNFVVLSRYHYYDNTTIFRTSASIGIIQGGSPHGNTNSDKGPGYDLLDEGFDFNSLPGAATKQNSGGPYKYVAGDLVMARSARANGASAQFFFGATDAVSNLDSQGVYVKFGATTEGLDVLKKILDSGGAGDAAPNPAVTINTVTITES